MTAAGSGKFFSSKSPEKSKYLEETKYFPLNIYKKQNVFLDMLNMTHSCLTCLTYLEKSCLTYLEKYFVVMTKYFSRYVKHDISCLTYLEKSFISCLTYLQINDLTDLHLT